MKADSAKDSTSSLIFVDKLPESIALQHYIFSVQDTHLGIKKSKLRKHYRHLLNCALAEHAYAAYSRAYCGNEVIQITSSAYELGCDYECTYKFVEKSTFFTTGSEIMNMQGQLQRSEEHIILCTLWGLKEAVAKMLNIPLHELLAAGTLRNHDGGWHIAGIQRTVYVYTECRGSNIIVVTYCERN